MVITKVERLMLPNILQSEQVLHIWNPCQIACPSIPVLWILGHSFLRYEGSKVGNHARFCRNSKFGGPYLPHHWSDWPKILDLVLWVPKQHVYQVSLKSETVGFKFSVILGDLTRNDPCQIHDTRKDTERKTGNQVERPGNTWKCRVQGENVTEMTKWNREY